MGVDIAAQGIALRKCGRLPAAALLVAVSACSTFAAPSPAWAVPASVAPPPPLPVIQPETENGGNETVPEAPVASEYKGNLLMIRAGTGPAAVKSGSITSVTALQSFTTASTSQFAEPGISIQPTAAPPVSANPDGAWSFWSDIRSGLYRDDAATPDVTGSFAEIGLGFGYHLSDDVEMGLAFGAEHVAENVGSTGSQTRRDGVTAGPYAVVSLTGTLAFEARAQWGWADEDRREDIGGTLFAGDALMKRFLLEARLSSRHELHGLQAVPDLSFFYGRDRHDAHTLTDGTSVLAMASDTETLARLSAGLALSRDMEFETATLRPFVAARVSWDVIQPDNSADELRATAAAGLTYETAAGTVSASAEWDGIASHGHESAAARLSFTREF